MERNIAIIDLESTSSDPYKDRIVEIALLVVDRNLNEVHPLVSTYINPGVPIDPKATEVHKISDEMVANAPTFAQVSDSLFEALKDCDLCFYNGIRFDLPMLIEEFARAGKAFTWKDKKLIDPYIVYREKEKRDLTAALRFYAGKEMEDAHQAGADVRATLDILRGQMAMYPDLDNPEAIHALTEPEKRCDLAGKFVWENGIVVMNFGEHKGKPAVDQQSYLAWMLKKDFPAETKDFITNFLLKK